MIAIPLLSSETKTLATGILLFKIFFPDEKAWDMTASHWIYSGKQAGRKMIQTKAKESNNTVTFSNAHP